MIRRLTTGLTILGIAVWVPAIGGVCLEEQPEDWSSYIYCADDTVVRDDELATAVSTHAAEHPFGSLVFVFTQCFSGGMLDDLAEQLDGAGDIALFASSSHDESAWFAGVDTAAGCLKACGLKRPISYYVEALAGALEEALRGDLTLAEVGVLAEQRDAAAPGGAATLPAVCVGDDRVTEPERPQTAFLGGGAALRLGAAMDGTPLPTEDRYAVLFVGEAVGLWALQDLERFHGVLAAYGFPPSQVFVLAGSGPDVDVATDDGSVEPLDWPPYVDGPATREGLFAALESVFRELGPDGQLVFWTTGHGDHERLIPWSEAMVIDADGPVVGALSTDDLLLSDDTLYDLYRFDGAEGERMGVLMASSEFDTYLHLYDQEHQLIASDDDSGGGTDAYLELELPETGTYFVMANAFNVDEGGGYRLDLWRRSPIAWDTAEPVTLGGSRLGVLDSADPRMADGAHYDLYAVELPEGALVRVELVSAVFDAFLWVYDPEHAQIASADDVDGHDAALLLSAPIAGRYVIVASSFAPAETGSYELSVASGLDPSWGETVEIGSVDTGSLATTDRLWPDGAYFDLYVLTGSAGEAVAITLLSEAFDAYLYVFDESFHVLGEDDDSGGGSDAALEIVIPSSGTLFVVATSYDIGERGPYTLRLETGTGEIMEIPWESAEVIRIGDRVRGDLLEGDGLWEDGTFYDLVAFDGRRGDVVSLSLRSGAFDAFLMVYGPDREPLGSDDDSGGGRDAHLQLGLPSDGRYTIVVNCFFAGGQGEYVLSLDRVR